MILMSFFLYSIKIRSKRTCNDRLKSPIEACPDAPPTNLAQLKGNMMLIKRGGCSFLEKAIVAQNSGVIGAIIFNNEVDDVDSNIDMVDDGSEQSHLVDIPIVWLQGKNGHMILNSIYKHGVSRIADKVANKLFFAKMA